ncbi:ribosomal-protein-alanine N-acetyltransferase [Synechococcus sp. MIT S9509]|uniref:GNAT family N-acetyltransferase n=1 Tax=Synechococcus sp. MIT S9509 TaxID=1801630 RepID=UPI0007BAF467|nr:N-acetyltransferase [Synechococcus sp. MIT S9509]KZR93744.1 ribosomal-protein-alanine N-acetyltransferase [Synechococcus sp. MIT S9509]
MHFEVFEPKTASNVVLQIAGIHATAYSFEHFTASFSLDKLYEYNHCLIHASELTVLAVDNHQVVGFLIAGPAVGLGVKKFSKKNRIWLLFHLLSKPNVFIDKFIRVFLNIIRPPSPSKAPFRLLSIAINPAYQSNGVGRAMMNFFERQLLLRGQHCYGLSVKSSNAKAICFYERNGFVKEFDHFNSSYYIKNLSAL